MIISKNAVAILVLFLSFIGLEVTEDGIFELISAITTVVSFAMMILNQLERSNVYNFFFKKKD